jgi:hypothetical protein
MYNVHYNQNYIDILDHVNYEKQAFKTTDVEILDTYWSKNQSYLINY